jgi:hypothetical protein
MPLDEYTMWLERDRSGNNVSELQRAHDQLLQAVKRIDPLTIAETADVVYRPDGVPRILIPFLQSWFTLRFVPYGIRAEHPQFDTLPMKTLALQHLVSAADNQGTAVRIMNRWIDIRDLRHGAVLGAHFSRTVNELLNSFFAVEPETRMRAVLRWGGKPVELGDVGFVFKFFPRLPVALMHWHADDEFPSYSKILFDVSASNYMPTHGLAVLTEFLAHRLAEEARSTAPAE